MSTIVITEDQKGFSILQKISGKLFESIGQVNVRFYRLQPNQNEKQIASCIIEAINSISKSEKAKRFIITIDFERRTGTCPGQWALTIKEEIRNKGGKLTYPIDQLEVVIKNKKLENWLIADTAAIEDLFNNVSNEILTRIQEGADEVSASAVINNLSDTNNKHQFADLIVNQLAPLRMAQHSRSFRRFLRVLGHPVYADQSIDPAPFEL